MTLIMCNDHDLQNNHYAHLLNYGRSTSCNTRITSKQQYFRLKKLIDNEKTKESMIRGASITG